MSAPSLEEVVRHGDQMAEFLEFLLGDEVIRPYLIKLTNMTLPFSFTPRIEEPLEKEMLKEWDEIVGRLQEAKLIDSPTGDEFFVDEIGA